ncbi:MAG: type II toxin-antitoxin system PemK/MazF family toxin [Leucobacter sp.]|jgi:mRNA interferase MazF|nr:type II toxin-antitoxin system PemK/MazF family toxin [Leucobacter sp.]
MLTPGDVVELDLGIPTSSEAGMLRPAIVLTAAQVLRGSPNVIQVVPLTTTLRDSRAEIRVEPDALNGLNHVSAAQCQHIRSVATTRVSNLLGNVGPVILKQLRNTVALLIDA